MLKRINVSFINRKGTYVFLKQHQTTRTTLISILRPHNSIPIHLKAGVVVN